MESQKSVDQRRRAVLRLVGEHAGLLRSQGAVVETWRRHGGRRVRPYFRLAFRQGGRQRSIYIGPDRELAEEVRRQLSALQADHRRQQLARRRRKLLRRELARLKAEWGRELRKVGLRLKGYEVRGWRGGPRPGEGGQV